MHSQVALSLLETSLAICQIDLVHDLGTDHQASFGRTEGGLELAVVGTVFLASRNLDIPRYLDLEKN
jgi:hypothetical protein